MTRVNLTKLETKASKFLSMVLRHKPKAISLILDPEGWADIEELISKFPEKYHMTREFLDQIVENDSKNRYAISGCKTKIRASQGHSIKVSLKLTEVVPPRTLYHGTPEYNREKILANGISKMQRHHVHLSKEIGVATEVGNRRGNSIILTVDTEAMLREGYKFFVSDNGVYLVDHVPSKFIAVLSDIK